MTDAIKVEESMSSNCPLQASRDTSTTHTLVFPTSATAHNDFDTFGLDDFNMDENDDPNGMLSTIHNDLFDSEIGFLEVFQEMTSSPHNGGPIGNLSNPNSPTGESGRHHSSAMNGPSVGKNTQSKDPQDEPPNLNQQPLAMGYYLSTAQPGPLPKWFWSTCPENEYQCPTCLKAALHIHCSSNHDDYYQLKKQSSSHPLDSTLTPDVLRYVLENYNALSWLTFDAVQNNRQSCLPIHFVVLLQMYHALNAFV
ncbi:hypothetical protein FSP39_000508 [Pinctada imbricata]|uniref:Mediator of RNA polymerase II transcription subunit 13 n=1 Tax=Pinctada imbricata TaxID=66713 RepID=A0AA89BLB6_PINIB|nr:hypothetical protein FSP39_000508 [Pinctada imbricata]